MILPKDYILYKFHQYAGGVKYNKSSDVYQASCPICREGQSWLKKKRCYYICDTDTIYCFNCGWSSKPLKWIKEVTGDSYEEIYKEAEEFDLVPSSTSSENKDINKKKVYSLPYDSINLFDNTQISYYKDNVIINKALDIINKRNITNAINRPKSLWLSLKDTVHKNRLIIPFYDKRNNIIFYQSRSILDNQNNYPKYLSKKNSDKSLYGVNSIDLLLGNIFIFEGPINAFFVKNGIAVCGIQEKSDTSLTALQQEQLNDFNILKKIWVLDSQWIDKASFLKTNRLINQNENVFIWPENIGKHFKDFNDLTIYTKKNEITSNFILSNTFNGINAKLQMSKINYLKK